MFLLHAVALLFLSSCSSPELVPFVNENLTLLENSRMSVEGTACTAKPGTTILPKKILFIMDQSGSLNAENDPTVDGVSNRQRAARAVVQAFQTDPAYSFSFIYFNTNVWRCPLSAPWFIQGDMNACLRQLVEGQNTTDMYSAFVEAYNLIRADLLDLDPRTARRTSYEIIFFSDGIPNTDGQNPPVIDKPEEMPVNILLRVGEVMSLLDPANGGAGSIRIHSVFLQGVMATGSNDYNIATDLLAQIAARGNGNYVNAPNASQLNFLQFIQTSIAAVERFKTFFVTDNHVHNEPDGAQLDSDGDGIPDDEEASTGLNPRDPDSDHDGCSDKAERIAGFDPKVVDCGCLTPGIDSDKDGLSDCDEDILKTNRELPDTDGDGMTDGIELWAGTDPLRDDAQGDPDGDGVPNLKEVAEHTNPFKADGAGRNAYAYKYTFSNRRMTLDQRECFDYKVENITLGITLPVPALELLQGENKIHLFFSTTPSDVPEDLGTWHRQVFKARYLGSGHKEPADGLKAELDGEVL
ncbi:MAG: hypothetical protein V1495_10570 [Pseudomonadota bacterium]